MKNKKVKTRKTIIAVVLVTVIVTVSLIAIKNVFPYIFTKEVTYTQLSEMNLEKCNKLMIVAHPDDELLWGGAHLIEDDYFVVCITRGDDKVRRAEFEKVLAETDDVGLMLSYPDKIVNKRSAWTFCKDDIEDDLETIIEYKDWDVIVTHNAAGEYKHQHHIMTHNLVREACDEAHTSGKQMYFGTYYKKDELPDDLNAISEDVLAKKQEIMELYESQQTTIKKLSHMVPYEEWTQR